MESLIIMFVAGVVLGIVIANLPMFRPRYHKGEEAMTSDTPSDLVKPSNESIEHAREYCEDDGIRLPSVHRDALVTMAREILRLAAIGRKP